MRNVPTDSQVEHVNHGSYHSIIRVFVNVTVYRRRTDMAIHSEFTLIRVMFCHRMFYEKQLESSKSKHISPLIWRANSR